MQRPTARHLQQSKRETLEYKSLNGVSSSNLSPQKSGNSMEEEAERVEEPEDMEDARRTKTSLSTKLDSYQLTETEVPSMAMTQIYRSSVIYFYMAAEHFYTAPECVNE